MIKLSATNAAFDQFRKLIGNARPPNKGMRTNPDQFKLMQEADGLQQWCDGAVIHAAIGRGEQPIQPVLTQTSLVDCCLWVVRIDDVVYAPESGLFGKTLESGVIKHTNLTGGAEAFSGGEVLLLDESTIVFNGCSGRYGPRTGPEMVALEVAFRNSGYHVWSMGFDEEAARAMPFVGVEPKWVG